MKNGYRMSTLDVSSALEAKGFDYYEYYMNKGGHFDCKLSSESGMYFLAFSGEGNFDSWSDDEDYHTWRWKVWTKGVVGPHSMYLGCKHTENYYLVSTPSG